VHTNNGGELFLQADDEEKRVETLSHSVFTFWTRTMYRSSVYIFSAAGVEIPAAYLYIYITWHTQTGQNNNIPSGPPNTHIFYVDCMTDRRPLQRAGKKKPMHYSCFRFPTMSCDCHRVSLSLSLSQIYHLIRKLQKVVHKRVHNWQ